MYIHVYTVSQLLRWTCQWNLQNVCFFQPKYVPWLPSRISIAGRPDGILAHAASAQMWPHKNLGLDILLVQSLSVGHYHSLSKFKHVFTSKQCSKLLLIDRDYINDPIQWEIPQSTRAILLSSYWVLEWGLVKELESPASPEWICQVTLKHSWKQTGIFVHVCSILYKSGWNPPFWSRAICLPVGSKII